MQYIHRSFRRWISSTDPCQSGLCIPLFTFCNQLTESVRMMACVVWLSPPWTIQRKARVIVSTSIVKLEVETAWWWLHFAWQWSPTEPSLRSCSLLFSWRRSLISDSFCPVVILDSAFPGFLAEVSYRDARIGFDVFPTPWFAWSLSAGIPQLWVTFLTHPRLAPSQSVAFVSFTASWIGLWGFRSEVYVDLLHFLSTLHWWQI